MRRLRFDRFGLDALRLEDLPRPAISGDQAIVRVKAAGLNPSDVTNVKGGFSQTTLPRTPGRDYAGVVEEGPGDWAGSEVWGSGAEFGFTNDGSHAEFIAVPAASLVRKPSNLSFTAASAAGVPFIAAWAALIEAVQIKEGETALIFGAAGAVGRAGCQLALWRGARVIGVDREAGQIDGVEIMASSDDIAAKVRERTQNRGAEVCLDAVGGPLFYAGLASLALGGRLASIVAKGDGKVTFDLRDFYHRELRLFGVDTLKRCAVRSAAIHRELARLFEAGVLAVAEPEPVRLEDAIEAYKSLDTGSHRKITLVDR
jgi:NADPH:quinone reductase